MLHIYILVIIIKTSMKMHGFTNIYSDTAHKTLKYLYFPSDL